MEHSEHVEFVLKWPVRPPDHPVAQWCSPDHVALWRWLRKCVTMTFRGHVDDVVDGLRQVFAAGFLGTTVAVQSLSMPSTRDAPDVRPLWRWMHHLRQLTIQSQADEGADLVRAVADDLETGGLSASRVGIWGDLVLDVDVVRTLLTHLQNVRALFECRRACLYGFTCARTCA